MAKSLRSKFKRRMKAERRKRYAVKELNQLKTALSTRPDPTIVKLVDIKKSKCRSRLKIMKNEELVKTKIAEQNKADNEDGMEVDSTARTFNRKFRDQNGNFPDWMNPRKIKKIKSSGKLKKKSKSKW
ncbi:hypothetical protein CHUAL_000416 [Chamberlinius hualienensis]